jgi:hypothetical protein
LHQPEIVNSQAEARASSSFSVGRAVTTEYTVVSTVDPPASQTANFVPGYKLVIGIAAGVVA